MTERLYIGTLAKRSGRSVHTIRWYETQGLMPGVVREPGGRRVYHPNHVEHLIFLNWLRRTGMSVADMRALTALAVKGWRTLDARRSLLRAHRARVESEIAELGTVLTLIDAKVAYYDEWMANKKRPPATRAPSESSKSVPDQKLPRKRGSVLRSRARPHASIGGA